jgi:hypothetical protein
VTWQQCGGIGWNGATNCEGGSTCVVVNDYYHQCVPNPTVLPTIAPNAISASPSAAPVTANPTATPTLANTAVQSDYGQCG